MMTDEIEDIDAGVEIYTESQKTNPFDLTGRYRKTNQWITENRRKFNKEIFQAFSIVFTVAKDKVVVVDEISADTVEDLIDKVNKLDCSVLYIYSIELANEYILRYATDVSESVVDKTETVERKLGWV